MALTVTHHRFATMATSCVPAVAAADVCANCGQEGGDSVNLKNCTACLLVKYCSVDCQKAHRKVHKKACKQRAAELKDERLYSRGHEQPEGDSCPICTLRVPMPTANHSMFKVCCMEIVCNGCLVSAIKMGINDKCPFCRTPRPKDDAKSLEMVQARVQKNDLVAIRFLGDQYSKGRLGLEKDMSRAVELWTEAANLGSVDACYGLGQAYRRGDGVQIDVSKCIRFYEKAAMLGHSMARHNLGFCEQVRGNHDRAVRHYLIAANMGFEESLENIRELFKEGLATKSQYGEALQGYQDALKEMKSPGREEAKQFFNRFGTK